MSGLVDNLNLYPQNFCHTNIISGLVEKLVCGEYYLSQQEFICLDVFKFKFECTCKFQIWNNI